MTLSTIFPGECLIYFAIMSVPHLLAFVVGCGVILSFPRKDPGVLLRRSRGLGSFIGIFLIVSSVFNGLWSCLIWDHLYISMDYVFDFMPFWPITQRVIDAPWGDEHGRLLGVSLFQLQVVWLLFAGGTWAVTIFLYRIVRRRLWANKALHATAAAPGS